MAIAPTTPQAATPVPLIDESLPDDELVDWLRAGEDAAFDVLVARHRPWLVQLATRLLGNDAHAAEDLAQESLLKLHATVCRDRRPMRVRPWLTVVARHASLDQHRRRRPDLPGELPESAVLPERPFDLDPALTQAWSALGGRHREVMYLRELMGCSYREIASIMGLSHSAVETLLFRARGALRREYERAGGERFGCGILGLGLYRFATVGGQREAEHVAGCVACRTAADTLAGLAGLPAPAVPTPAGPSGGIRPGMADLVVRADVSSAASSLWAPLAAAEPVLIRILSAGVAMAATIIPAVVSQSGPSPARAVAAPVGVEAAAVSPSANPEGTVIQDAGRAAVWAWTGPLAPAPAPAGASRQVAGPAGDPSPAARTAASGAGLTEPSAEVDAIPLLVPDPPKPLSHPVRAERNENRPRPVERLRSMVPGDAPVEEIPAPQPVIDRPVFGRVADLVAGLPVVSTLVAPPAVEPTSGLPVTDAPDTEQSDVPPPVAEPPVGEALRSSGKANSGSDGGGSASGDAGRFQRTTSYRRLSATDACCGNTPERRGSSPPTPAS